MKVYVLTQSFGSHEYQFEEIVSVFKDAKDAEIRKQEIEDYYRNPTIPSSLEIYTEQALLDIYYGDIEVEWSEEKIKELEDYVDLVQYTEFNGCRIQEYELR